MYLCAYYVLLVGAVKIGASDNARLFVSPVQHLFHGVKVDRDRVLKTVEWQHKIGVIGRVQRYSINLITLDN